MCDKRRSESSDDKGLNMISKTEAGAEDYGCYKVFHIDRSGHRKVLIAGADSYIGKSVKWWLTEHYPNIEVTAVNIADGSWNELDFTPYDTVVYAEGDFCGYECSAGREEMPGRLIMQTDLAKEAALKCKNAGVKQFIFMSSMDIYGDSVLYRDQKCVDEHTMPAPDSLFGNLKWSADKGIRELADSRFSTAVLRLPLVYGKGAKGDYSLIAELVKRFSFFPNIDNRFSMLYIDNLCEMISLLALSGEGGVYFPQNAEYSSISSLIREIGITVRKPIFITNLLNPVIFIASQIPGKAGRFIGKVFGTRVYDQKLSKYEGMDYRVLDLRESIIATEES